MKIEKLKPGALHKIIGLFGEWKIPIIVPTNLPLASGNLTL